jgi:hypothetical protein
MRSKDLPHNPFKVPWFMLCAAVAVFGLATGTNVLVAALVLAGSLVALATIAAGRNPRWLQSPSEREARRKQEAGEHVHD